jgi:hypothetical protein
LRVNDSEAARPLYQKIAVSEHEERAMRKIVLAIALFIVGATFANAITLRGIGSCGQWQVARSAPDAGPRSAYEFWVLGYMSGVAMATGKDALATTRGNAIFAGIDTYCRTRGAGASQRYVALA